MSDTADYWRDVKAHFRKQKGRYEQKINPMIVFLYNHPKCMVKGDHHQIGEWHFWNTGTVMNPKTKEYLSIEELYKKYND